MTSLARERPHTFDRIVAALSAVGVVGSEGGFSFVAQDLGDIETDLRSAGYTGGSPLLGVPARPRDGVDLLLFDSDRFQDVGQAEQAWTVDYLKRWRDRIETEVADWLARLRGLRSQIEQWIAASPVFASLQIVDGKPARMHEHLMQRFGVQAAQMPVFELRTDTYRPVMRFQPKGLWVIGANGRVDLITKSASPILIDSSELLSKSPNWQLYYSKDARPVPFNKDSFEDLVRGGMP